MGLGHKISKRLWDLERFGLDPQSLIRRVARSRDLPAPVLINSIPKSGTHLLERVVSLHPLFRRKLVRTVSNGSLERLGGWKKQLDGLSRGEYLLTHLPYTEPLANYLDERHMPSILIVRDLRALILSASYYILNNTSHELHHYVKGKSLEDAVQLTLTGPADNMKKNFLTNIRKYGGWVGHTGTLVIKYEELGSSEVTMRAREVSRIFEHLRVPASPALVADIAARAISSASPTFRKGGSSEWRTELSADVIALLDNYVEDFAVFGYS